MTARVFIVFCPKCDLMMADGSKKEFKRKEERYIFCSNKKCELYETEFEVPMAELKPRNVEIYHCIDCSKLWTVYCPLKGIERKGTDDSCDDFLPLEKGF